MNRPCRGFTLIELLIVIAIIGTFVGLLIPPTCVGSREVARASMCKNNIKQLERSLAMECELHRHFPGYINALGNKDERMVRASWVVKTFPYIEQSELWDRWSAGKPEFKAIEVFICPSDPPVDETEPNLSYATNAGYIGNADGEENKANGLFFDRTRIADGAPGPSDERDALGRPLFNVNLEEVVKAEGQTILLAENTHALYWGYVSTEDQQHTKDRSYHFGFCWEQPAVVTKGMKNDTAEGRRRINGNLEDREISGFNQMTPADAFPASYHPEVVNVAFANGSAKSVHEDIDPLVYAQLMTSDHKASDLVSVDGRSDNELPQPDENDY